MEKWQIPPITILETPMMLPGQILKDSEDNGEHQQYEKYVNLQKADTSKIRLL